MNETHVAKGNEKTTIKENKEVHSIPRIRVHRMHKHLGMSSNNYS
jgi:hypothetical protein